MSSKSQPIDVYFDVDWEDPRVIEGLAKLILALAAIEERTHGE